MQIRPTIIAQCFANCYWYRRAYTTPRGLAFIVDHQQCE